MEYYYTKESHPSGFGTIRRRVYGKKPENTDFETDLPYNPTPRIRGIEIVTENFMVCEGENSKRRRKVAQDFFDVLIENLKECHKEIVRTETGNGVYFNFEKVLGSKFSILFYNFSKEDDHAQAFWINSLDQMRVNVNEKYTIFKQLMTKDDFNGIFRLFESVIFHELIHKFDHLRYRAEFQPGDFKSFINNSAEFEAYFQQYARTEEKGMKNIKTKDQFFQRYGKHVGEFIDKFWKVIPREFKKEIRNSRSYTNKWNRRLFHLYNEMLSELTPKDIKILETIEVLS